jgi:predicted nucleic acid-binding protein
MTVVIDASTAVSALVDTGDESRWAVSVLAQGDLVAPHLLPVEIGASLRGLVLGQQIRSEQAREALENAVDWEIELYPFDGLQGRVWELRDNLTPYDAWYVALAEHHDAPLATLDRRLAAATGPRCEFLLPG